MFKAIFFLTMFFVDMPSAVAEIMTAKCASFTGYTVDVQNSNFDKTPMDLEKTKGIEYTVVMEIGSKEAVITRLGPKPIREVGRIVSDTNDLRVIVVNYPGTHFMYSIFLVKELMDVSKHTVNFRISEFGDELDFVMRGNCKFSFQ
jgi:hypothetical protein